MQSPVSMNDGKVSVAGVGSAPVIPLILGMVGAYLIWFGVHYWRSQSVVWPTDPIKVVLQGKPIPSSQTATSTTMLAALDTTSTNSGSNNGGNIGSNNGGNIGAGNPPTGPIQTQARAVLASHGWTSPAEWTAFVSIVDAESSWNPRVANPTSGALGIAQALGHGGPNTAGTLGNEYGGYGLTDAQARLANSGNAYYQLVWMANYIHDVYGTPEAAWAFHLAHGSY